MSIATDPVVLYAATVESLELMISTSADPTATPPAFSLTATTATAPGAFTNGTWSGTFNGTQTKAITPTIGSAGSLVIAAATRYALWIRVTLGGETAVWIVGEINVP